MHQNTQSFPSSRNTHRALRRLAGLALALLPLGACAVAPEQAPDGADILFAEEAGFEILAELHPDPETVVRFTKEPSRGDDDSFAVSTMVLGPDNGVLFEKLITEQNATPLEMFLALAPAGSAAPDELLVAHRSETRAQGRDETVRHLSPDTVRALTVFDSTYCDSYTAFQDFISLVWYGQPGSGVREQFVDSSSGSHFLAPNSADAGYMTACNYRSNRVDTKQALLCSRYRYATSGDTSWVCDSAWIGDGQRVYKSWGCESTGSYCKERYFQISAAYPDPAGTTSFLGLVQLHYIF